MKYITTVQVAKKWNISANRVFILAREEKILTAKKSEIIRFTPKLHK